MSFIGVRLFSFLTIHERTIWKGGGGGGKGVLLSLLLLYSMQMFHNLLPKGKGERGRHGDEF